MQFGRAVCGALAADVMAGGECDGVEFPCGTQQVAEFYGLVTAHTGDRCLAPCIGIGEILNHRIAKGAFVIQHIMGNANPVGHIAGIIDVLPSATGPLFLDRRAMIIQLQRDPHHVIAQFLQQGCGDGGINPPGHGNDHARTGGHVECGRVKSGEEGFCAAHKA